MEKESKRIEMVILGNNTGLLQDIFGKVPTGLFVENNDIIEIITTGNFRIIADKNQILKQEKHEVSYLCYSHDVALPQIKLTHNLLVKQSIKFIRVTRYLEALLRGYSFTEIFFRHFSFMRITIKQVGCLGYYLEKRNLFLNVVR